MKKQLGMKIYLWLSGVVLPIWLINYFVGQHHGVEVKPVLTRVSAEQNPVQMSADRQPAMALKLSYSLSQSMTKNIRMRPIARYHEATALNMSFFLSRANAMEIGAVQTPAIMENKERTRQSKERLDQIALNVDKLSREKVALPARDPFAAILPPPPPAPKIAIPPPPPPVPMAPAFPYTFMGRMIENGTTTLYLSRQDQSYSVKLNDVLENNYRVDKIDNDQVIFTYLPLNTQQVMYIGRAG